MIKLECSILNKMLDVVRDNTKHYQTDVAIDVYSLLTFEDPASSFLWLCRQCGTNLYPLPLNEYGANALEFYIREQGDKIRFFKLTADDLQELTLDQVKEML